jgi:hypothetical protein
MQMRLPTLTAATLSLAGVTFAGALPGHADANAAVCAQTYGKSDGLACNYATYEQCRAAVSGLAGSCIDNPYLRGGPKPTPPRKRRGA